MKKYTRILKNPKRHSFRLPGFTLIELLIVVVIIAALAVVVFVALNQVKRLADARNARRITDTDSIQKAIQEYQVDKGALPSVLQNLTARAEYQIGTGNNISTCKLFTSVDTVTQDTCVNLSADLVQYLKSIPTDPLIGSASATGYTVSVDTNNNVTVKAAGTELASSALPPSQTYSLSGNVFDDIINGNGVQDAGETGYSGGATISLNTGQTATTDSNGNYSFPALAQGTYTVTLSVPSQYTITTANPVPMNITANATQNFGVIPFPPNQTGLTTVTIQSLGMPGYLQTVTDPTLGDQIKRVSDQTAFGTSNLYLTHQYAKEQVWNADESMILLTGWYFNTGYMLPRDAQRG